MTAHTVYAYMETPLGRVMAGSREGALCGLWFEGQKYWPRTTAEWVEDPDCPVFAPLRAWLSGYFAGKNPRPEFAIRPRGTDFQQTVWKLLLGIPYGRVTTYGALAGQLARRRGLASMPAQAVGGAVGHNPISILIPCHRVVGSGGGLTGYSGGLDKKEALLRLEGALAPGGKEKGQYRLF